MNKKLIAGLFGAGVILTAAPAFAGDWRADRGGCTTQIVRVNDGRGNGYDNRGRYDNGRYDRGRFDKNKTERVTVCSRTSFKYQPDRRELKRWNGRHDAYRQPALSLSYDGRLHMYYRYAGGIKLYIRG